MNILNIYFFFFYVENFKRTVVDVLTVAKSALFLKDRDLYLHKLFGQNDPMLQYKPVSVLLFCIIPVAHPRFFNQLYAGMEPYSMVASFIIEALKPSL